MGSIFFGSFVLALIQIVRMILERVRSNNSENLLLRIVAAIAACFVSCCEVFWKMLSTNAYYVCAMFGLSFCKSMRLGVELTSVTDTAMFYAVGQFMLYGGVLLVVSSTTLLARFTFDSDDENEVLYLYMTVTLISILLSYMLLSVYSVRRRVSRSR